MDSTERGRNANDTGAGEEVIGSDSKELNPSVNGECFFFAPLTVFLRYPKVIQLFSVVRFKCNNCERNLLQNISECYCCQELEGCVKGLGSDLVVAELDPNAAALRCITEHPGFNPVCLQRWSLRLAADKYRTKGKQKYRQTGSEDR